MKQVFILLFGVSLLFSGCGQETFIPETGADADGHTAPTKFTVAANKKMLAELPTFDQQDLEDVRKGFIATLPSVKATGIDGERVFDQTTYDFIKGSAPPSVNPSLWRQAKLNKTHGLFKVTDGVYQVRAFDVSNMTIIEGETGWIIVDPLTSQQTAAMALALARKHLGEKPITGMIFTHSHVDHFGGALGVLSVEEAAERKVPIIAPQGFMKEATSENVVAGMVMGRRSNFFMGTRLARTERGHVDTGLGKEIAFGLIGILHPTIIVDHTAQEIAVDGVQFVFQNVPGSEAPAELTLYMPEKKTFCGGEIVNRTMHNIYTLRGAKTRDALAWSNYIDESLQMFGDAEVYFGTHHWPIWGNSRIVTFLKQQRDTYKYIHDQTLRLANKGFTPLEIADQLELPASLKKVPSNRGYYGTVRHNSRAVYNFYFGYFDANPAHLNPLPPEDAGRHYVEFMGGAESVITGAKTYFDKGEYRWVAEVLNHVVFADPENKEARTLLARTYDQLGYQAESGPWRDFYLTGAYELRHGRPEKGVDISDARDLLMQTPIENFLDVVATNLNGPKAEGVELKINFTFTDLDETHVLWMENSVLHHRKAAPIPDANATLNITHALFMKIILKRAGGKDLLFSDDLNVDGSRIDLVRFFSLLDKIEGPFNIVEP